MTITVSAPDLLPPPPPPIPVTGLLAPLSGDRSARFVGAGVTVQVTAPDGSAVTRLSAPIRLTFKIPEGIAVEIGQQLMVAYWDAALGWRFIAATRVGDELVAIVDEPGTYVLAVVPQ